MAKPTFSKGEMTYQRIIESAFNCIGKDGYHGTTFQTIADHAKVSQPLVVKYIGSREEIMLKAIDYFLKTAKKKTESALSKKRTIDAKEKLTEYIRISFEIFTTSAEMKRFYSSIYALSDSREDIRKINADIKAGAILRIEEILKDGAREGSFQMKSVNHSARFIHNSLTGLLLNWNIENTQDKNKLVNNLTLEILKTLRSQS